LKLGADPGLAAIAADRVQRRAEAASAGERQELTEWARLLSTLSTAQLRRFLVEDSERATRLRQSLPALQLLSPTEREAVLQSESAQRSLRPSASPVTRAELEHAIRAACDVAGDDEVFVFGSQAILGQYPNAHEALRQSAEADISPVRAVDKVDDIGPEGLAAEARQVLRGRLAD